MSSKTRELADSRPSATNEERDERSVPRNDRRRSRAYEKYAFRIEATPDGRPLVDGRTRASRESANLASLTGPTYLTILRMILSVVFMAFALQPERWARIVALIVFIIAAITDKIDGIWARNSKQVTDLGAFLDPLADKMLVDLAFLFLVYIYVVPVWVFAIIIVRDLAVDGMRMMAARNSITIAASFFGKLKTTVQMTALITLLANLILGNDIIGVLGQIALYLALILTVLSGADYLVKAWPKAIKK